MNEPSSGPVQNVRKRDEPLSKDGQFGHQYAEVLAGGKLRGRIAAEFLVFAVAQRVSARGGIEGGHGGLVCIQYLLGILPGPESAAAPDDKHAG